MQFTINQAARFDLDSIGSIVDNTMQSRSKKASAHPHLPQIDERLKGLKGNVSCPYLHNAALGLHAHDLVPALRNHDGVSPQLPQDAAEGAGHLQYADVDANAAVVQQGTLSATEGDLKQDPSALLLLLSLLAARPQLHGADWQR